MDIKAAANPTKSFFVSMITRDITLEDCILDLVDNSVDSAWRREGSHPMGLTGGADLSSYWISILASSDYFSITDNCGGMSMDDARNHAFSFGRPANSDHDNYSIGVYGIGMKRAVFKLGSEIRVRSTFQQDNPYEPQSFAIPIDVKAWLRDDTPPWDFDIVADESLDHKGVQINVWDLTESASTSFGSPLFMQNLRRIIARDYALHLNRGLTISINEGSISPVPIEFLQSEEFQPVRVDYVDDVGSDPVSVEIIGGMATPPPESLEPNQGRKDGDESYGWYAICNGRVVLAADKTSISGWGSEDWPQWHYQYYGFIGVVVFVASNAAALPLTTTKRSIDTSSEIYKRAKPLMRDVSRRWIDYTNGRKAAIDEAKVKEAATSAIRIYDVKPHEVVVLPKFSAQPTERSANISYAVPLRRLRALGEALGSVNMPYKEVGLKSFEYAYDDLVGDE